MSTKPRIVRLMLWSGEGIDFPARQTSKPPRASIAPRNAQYFAARVADGSGLEPAGWVPLEVWEILSDGTASSSRWSGVSRRSRRVSLGGKPAATRVDDMLHLWTWSIDGKEHAYLLPAGRVKYA